MDSGFSFTYGVPFFNGIPLKYATTRIDVGGKLLTNLLSEVISHKDVNLQGETFLVNEIKESLCYVSTKFSQDMDICHQTKTPTNPILKEYVLPDYKATKKGYVRDYVPRMNMLEREQAKEQARYNSKKGEDAADSIVDTSSKNNKNNNQ